MNKRVTRWNRCSPQTSKLLQARRNIELYTEALITDWLIPRQQTGTRSKYWFQWHPTLTPLLVQDIPQDTFKYTVVLANITEVHYGEGEEAGWIASCVCALKVAIHVGAIWTSLTFDCINLTEVYPALAFDFILDRQISYYVVQTLLPQVCIWNRAHARKNIHTHARTHVT